MSTFDYSSFLQVLNHRSIHEKDLIAFTYLEDGEDKEINITYSELYKESRKIAENLLRVCKKGDRALLFYPAGLEFIKSFFGCLYAGVIAVPTFPPRMNRSLDRLESIMENCDAAVILTESSVSKNKFFKNLSDRYQVIETDLLKNIISDSKASLPEISLDDIAFLQYTSGSTGNPKGVIITHRNILANQELIKTSFNQNKGSLIIGWLPFYHDMGLIGNILHPVYMGNRSILMSPQHFLQRPFRWLKAISKYKGTTSGGPNFAYDLCVEKISKEEKETLDLSSWKTAFSGAEPVKLSTLNNFLRDFKSCKFDTKSLQPCYGMAEATLLISASLHGKGFQSVHFLNEELQYDTKESGLQEHGKAQMDLISCGPMNGFAVKIVDEKKAEREEGKVGEIWIKGESVAQGYWKRPEETRESFDAYLLNGEGPYFRTGDLGLIREGALFVTGRLKDLIIINGRNLYPQDIEFTIIESHPQIIPGGSAAFSIETEKGDGLVIIAEIDEKKETIYDEILEKIRSSVAQIHELEIGEIVLIRRGSILKTTSGKIQRKACKAAFLANEIRIIAASATHIQLRSKNKESEEYTDSEKKIISLLGRELGDPQIGIDENFFSYGLDSIKIANLSMMLSDEMEVDISLIFENPTIRSLAEKIDRLHLIEVEDIKPVSEKKYYDLSYTQRGLWFDQQLNSESTAYNLCTLVKLDKNINLSAFQYALDYLIEKHEILRTDFLFINDRPVQRINDNLDYKIQTYSTEDIEELISKWTKKSFDLENAPLFRANILNSRNEYYFFFLIHHLISDGSSINFFMKELLTAYDLFQINKKPQDDNKSIQYKDYVEWSNKKLLSSFMKEAKNYWVNQLNGTLPTLDLPFDYSFTSVKSKSGASKKIVLNKILQKQLHDLAKEKKVTLYTLMLSGFFVLLHRLSGQEDIIVGSPMSIRERKEFEEMQGLFVNAVMLRNNILKDDTYEVVINKVRDNLMSAFKYRTYPLQQLIEDIEIKVNPQEFPISQVFFNALNFLDENSTDELFDVFQSDLGREVSFNLNCYVASLSDGLHVKLDYRRSKFNEETINIFLLKYEQILKDFIKSTERKVSDIPLNSSITPRVPSFNDADWYDPTHSLTEIIYEQFERYRENIAIRTNKIHFTYRELNELTNQWARFIGKKYKDAEYVAIYVGHNEKMLIAMLSVLKAGKVYIHLDPQYPEQRIQSILEETKPGIIFTDEEQNDYVQKFIQGAMSICSIDDYKKYCLNESKENLAINSTADSIAYILYTSGSTGKPKGIIQKHKNVLHFISNYSGSIGINEEDKLSGFSSSSYDSFNNEVFGALLNGACYFPLSVKEMGDAHVAQEWLMSNGITICQLVPSLFRYYAGVWVASEIILSSVRIIKMTGEAVENEDFNLFKLITEPTSKFVVSYGSTESSLNTINLFGHVDSYAKYIMPIGFPVHRTSVKIVDDNLKELDVLEKGEIVIESDFITPGYWNQDKFNNYVFIEKDNHRCFRTGDIGRRLADGKIEWLGRIDFQVKINGIRFEPQEIEYWAKLFEGVDEAVAVVAHSDSLNINLFFKSERKINLLSFKNHIQKFIPLSLLPANYIQVEQFPLTISGKIDRKLLSAMQIFEAEGISSEENKSLTYVESELKCTVESIIGGEIKIESNLFSMSLNSIKAMQLASKIKGKFSVEITLKEIYENPTIKEISRIIQQASRSANKIISRISEKDHYELSSNQFRLWIQSQLMPYNIVFAYELLGEVDECLLEQAFGEVIERHEILRTTYSIIDGIPVQIIRDSVNFKIDKFLVEQIGGVEELLKKELWYRYDLREGPLLKASLVKCNSKQFLIGSVHHIISDGWSIKIIGEEILERYNSSKSGKRLIQESLNFHYKDYSSWRKKLNQATYNDDKAFWMKKFKNNLIPAEYPTDFPRPAIKKYQGKTVYFYFSKEVYNQYKEFCMQEGRTIFTILLAGYKTLIHKVSSNTNTLIGTLFSGRDSEDLNNQIGFYANAVPLCLEITPELSFNIILDRQRDELMGAYKHQNYPLDELVDDLGLEKSLSRSMLFDILMVLHPYNYYEDLIQSDKLSFVPLLNDESIARFDLTFNIFELKNDLLIQVEYDSNLYLESTIQLMMIRFRKLVCELVSKPSAPIDTIDYRFKEELEIEDNIIEADFDF